MFFIDFDPFLFFLIGFDCFEHDRGRCGWDRVWRALIRTNSYLLRFCQHERGQNLARSEVSRTEVLTKDRNRTDVIAKDRNKTEVLAKDRNKTEASLKENNISVRVPCCVERLPSRN